MKKGTITKPTKNRMGLRIGLSKLEKNQIVIQNYTEDGITESVYVDLNELDELIKQLDELIKQLKIIKTEWFFDGMPDS